MKDDQLYAVLAYAGAIPFIACALAALAGVGEVGYLGTGAEVAAAYGVAIASFMAGIHWGTWLYRSEQTPLNLLLSSNAITVVVWAAFVIAPVTLSLLVTGGAFLMLLLIDYQLAGSGLLSPAYLKTRRNVTAIVMVALLLTIFSS